MSIIFNKKNKNNVNNALEGKKSFKKLNSEELHQFVQNYNYDDGIEPFIWLVQQKTCDKGTALCLYWHLQPDYYSLQDKSENKEYQLIKEIEKHIIEDYYETELFAFDPKKEFITSKTNLSCIPKIIQEKTNGLPFERVSVEFAFLRNPDEKEQKTIGKKIKDAILILQNTNPDFEISNPKSTISEIINCVNYWKKKDLGKIKIENLSFLWLDALCQQYNWTWVIWDWETGKKIGATNSTKVLTCLADTIISHTIDGFQPTEIISKLFEDLDGAVEVTDVKNNIYSGIGLLFSSKHLSFNP